MKLLKLLLLTFGLGGLFVIILPMLLSASSNVNVLLGLLLIFLFCYFIFFVILNIIVKKGIKE